MSGYIGNSAGVVSITSPELDAKYVNEVDIGTAAATAITDYATAAQGTTADAALPKAGGAMTGPITTTSTFDGVDIAARDAILTATTTTANNALPKAGGTMTGNITMPALGTVDGRDLSVDGAKLDDIEAGADVTDTINVTAAGALMDSEVTNLAQVKAFNSADYATVSQGTLANSALQPGDSLAAGDLTGSLPAIDGSALTGLGGGVPAGVVVYHAANTAPTGFLKANGASLSTSTYADLFAVIGYTYGGSGGSFNVPDLRGEFMRGWDDSRGVDSGRSFGSYQADELKSHNHTLSAPTFGTSAAGAGWRDVSNTTRTRDTSYTGGSETRPRNIALLACIKY